MTQEPSSIGLSEIRQLHNEIMAAARMSLDKAIRIGELLTTIKAGLPHGKWLPWCTENLPFDARTAQRYTKLFLGRDRLKNDSVSDLATAYRLLADTREESKPSFTANDPFLSRYLGDLEEQDSAIQILEDGQAELPLLAKPLRDRLRLSALQRRSAARRAIGVMEETGALARLRFFVGNGHIKLSENPEIANLFERATAFESLNRRVIENAERVLAVLQSEASHGGGRLI
jgi:hypothetical protein